MSYTTALVTRLREELKNTQNELDRIRARPAPASEREDYVLGEMDIVNRQLDCKYDLRPIPRILICISADLTLAFVAVFVPDFAAEKARVEERLDQAVETATTGRQHFYLDKSRARILATLKDRAWRSALLLESCRSAFIRLNEILFPSGPQPQGIHALLGLFRLAAPIQEVITRRIVLGANAAMAYVRSRRPNLTLSAPPVGSSLSRAHLDGTYDSAKLLVERLHTQLAGPALPIKNEPEE